MNTAKAELNNYRQSPRKVRLVAGLIRGKALPQALAALQFTTKRASDPLYKLLKSAEANAKAQGLNADQLVVGKITVNGGPIMYRSLPMSRGRAFRMRKRTSKVFVELVEAPAKAAKKTRAEKAETKAASAKAKK